MYEYEVGREHVDVHYTMLSRELSVGFVIRILSHVKIQIAFRSKHGFYFPRC